MPVSIATAGNEPVPASSILSVMTLGAHYGDEVTLTADGDDAEAVLDELAALLASELDL
jgi:phosphocarrier protein